MFVSVCSSLTISCISCFFLEQLLLFHSRFFFDTLTFFFLVHSFIIHILHLSKITMVDCALTPWSITCILLAVVNYPYWSLVATDGPNTITITHQDTCGEGNTCIVSYSSSPLHSSSSSLSLSSSYSSHSSSSSSFLADSGTQIFMSAAISSPDQTYVDSCGLSWRQDLNYSTENLHSYSIDRSSLFKETQDSILYTVERFWEGDGEIYLCPNRTTDNLIVGLILTEVYWSTFNSRVFDLTLNGQEWASNVDILALSDGMPKTAITIFYPGPVRGDSCVTIGFHQISGKDNPKYNGFFAFSYPSDTIDYSQINNRSTLIRMTSSLSNMNQYNDVYNNIWSTDSVFSNMYSLSPVSSSMILNTYDPSLYNLNIRCSPVNGELILNIPITSGYSYVLTYGVIANNANTIGQTVYNVSINNNVWLSHLDVYRETGGQYIAYNKSIVLPFVNYSELTFTLSPTTGAACISLFSLVSSS